MLIQIIEGLLIIGILGTLIGMRRGWFAVKEVPLFTAAAAPPPPAVLPAPAPPRPRGSLHVFFLVLHWIVWAVAMLFAGAAAFDFFTADPQSAPQQAAVAAIAAARLILVYVLARGFDELTLRCFRGEH